MNAQLSNMQDLKKALEALRSGVPSREAVRVLGCNQPVLEDRFRTQLSTIGTSDNEIKQQKGMLISGAFGSGKSHLLEYFKNIALDENFVCSHVVISKETPLFDPGKLFIAAVESATAFRTTGEIIPGEIIPGETIKEIALSLKTNTDSYADLFVWANSPESEISQIFPATMMINEYLNTDPEMSEKIRGFWAGEKLSIADIRAGMRDIKRQAIYQLKAVPAKQLPIQQFQFVSRLIRAAGYRGWVLLIDEVELVGQYSRIQRGRAYGELARWLGHVESDQYPWLTSVATITDDFAAAVFDGKGDRHVLIPALEAKDTEEYRGYASRAETGIRLIDPKGRKLDARAELEMNKPDQATLDRTYSTLKSVHSTAYGWEAPEISGLALSIKRPMRQHVRRLINEWDLRRLYPDFSPDIEETPLSFDYTESPDLELASEVSDDVTGGE